MKNIIGSGPVFAQSVGDFFESILEFDFYKLNPLEVSFDNFLTGCCKRQDGWRHTRPSDDFYYSIFQFGTFVIVGKSGYDDCLMDNYTPIIDSKNGYSSFNLWDKNQSQILNDGTQHWMSLLNDNPIDLLKDTFYSEKDIWFLSYWEKIKRASCDWVCKYHFINQLNYSNIIHEILKAQIFVFESIINDPTIVIPDNWYNQITCCVRKTNIADPYKEATSVFIESYKQRFMDLLNQRKLLFEGLST